MTTAEQFAQAAKVAAAMRAEIGKALVGQKDVIDAVLCALLAGGHVLVEGVPGLGKTLLVRALARTMSGTFGRIQFTPDLMPADVTGHTLYDPKSQVFTTRRGPVFVNLLLADEINRAPAKTQAALLEVMQEGQVTIEGQAHALAVPSLEALGQLVNGLRGADDLQPLHEVIRLSQAVAEEGGQVAGSLGPGDRQVGDVRHRPLVRVPGVRRLLSPATHAGEATAVQVRDAFGDARLAFIEENAPHLTSASIVARVTCRRSTRSQKS